MLYLVGLGLSDETDITVKGLEVVKKASRVYLEAYTSILLVDQSVLFDIDELILVFICFVLQEKYYGRPIIVADREMVEMHSDDILANAQNEDVAFLVVGDPFGATTHTDLVLRAREFAIPVSSVPNASILSGIGACGLQLYNFGQTVSMVFFTDEWRPASFYDRIKENRDIGLHTLVLLDIKVKEPNLESLARGRIVYEPPRYMTVGTCARQMLEVEAERKGGAYGEDSLAVGAARVGGRDQVFVAGTLRELCDADEKLGPPLHSMVLLGRRTHELENDFVRDFAVDKDKWQSLWLSDYQNKR
ncbi:diphthine synthase [Niveomyces insectorum RCEF 264]|uniref:diphthine methyl ester synthase n=1 Tax=Niveomyces insectorum RCEF 264 TaxID=1081102 RepID=A0A167YNK5_9HYPO|nr:diphthine synthase [Niveomyces insectorum RCEF 264]